MGSGPIGEAPPSSVSVPERARSKKTTPKDITGSEHSENDPYLQQVLDLFNGHLIDP
jgi:hypothetical protein